MSSSSGSDATTTGAFESSTGCGTCDAEIGTTLELAESSGASGGPMTTSEASETAGPSDDPYSSCPNGTNDECPAGEDCLTVEDLTMIPGTSCGAPGCSKIDCPEPSSGTAAPRCAVVASEEWCVLDCEGGLCPAGMECMWTNAGHVCVWLP